MIKMVHVKQHKRNVVSDVGEGSGNEQGLRFITEKEYAGRYKRRWPFPSQYDIQNRQRFYFWSFTIDKWQQFGNSNGYDTYQECFDDNEFSREKSVDSVGRKYPWAILRAECAVFGNAGDV